MFADCVLVNVYICMSIFVHPTKVLLQCMCILEKVLVYMYCLSMSIFVHLRALLSYISVSFT